MDNYVLFKNAQLLYSGPNFPTPDVNQHVAQEGGGYDAARYAQRGDGYADWNAAGRPPYDTAGRELDVAGWPTGKMKDGTTDPATPVAPAPSLIGGLVPVTLATVDSTAVISFDVPTAGAYYLMVGEGVQQGEQAWLIEQHGEVKATGNVGVDPGAAFSLEAGPGTLSAQYQPGSLAPSVQEERIAAGRGVSFGHYGLRAA